VSPSDLIDAPGPSDGVAITDFDHNSAELTEGTLWRSYERLLESGRVSHSTAHDGFYLLSRFEDVKTALRDSETFTSGHGHRIPVIGTPRAIPIDYDPPLHTDYRRLMTAALNPARIRELQPFVRDLITELVADFHAHSGGDAVKAIALPLPLRVLTQVVGFSDETVGLLRRLTEQMWENVNTQDYDEARRELRAVVDAEIARHRATTIDDFLTGLLGASVEGRPIEDDEAARVLLTLAIAGHETTMNAASSLLWLLGSDIELQDQLRADPSIAPAYVEEMLRLRTPSQNFARWTARDVMVGDVEIPEGSRVLLCYAAANRDPSQYPEPERFDPSRASRAHLAFGWGIHQCMGAGLARAELAVLLQTLCTYPRFRVSGEVTFSSPQGGIHYGPTALPLAFEPAA
jgi:cytochrome P450